MNSYICVSSRKPSSALQTPKHVLPISAFCGTEELDELESDVEDIVNQINNADWRRRDQR